MTINVQLKNMAIDLRKSGKSYSEILNEVPVSKGVLSLWLKDISISKEQRLEIKRRVKEGRVKSRKGRILALKTKSAFKDMEISSNTEVLFRDNIKDPFFSTGILLYWAEGSRGGNYFSFTNSDPNMVSIMRRWIIKYLPQYSNSMTYRLYMRGLYSEIGKNESYWSGILGIPKDNLRKTIYSPAPEYSIRDSSYIGSIRMDITKVEALKTMLILQKQIIKYYDSL